MKISHMVCVGLNHFGYNSTDTRYNQKDGICVGYYIIIKKVLPVIKSSSELKSEGLFVCRSLFTEKFSVKLSNNKACAEHRLR